jgi:hypothetical protein
LTYLAEIITRKTKGKSVNLAEFADVEFSNIFTKNRRRGSAWNVSDVGIAGRPIEIVGPSVRNRD